MTQEGFKRKLTAILSADAVGYSRLMAEDEAATVTTLGSYREVMSTLIKQHRGRVVDSPGDNVLAEFSSVVDAVQCAVAVQNELQIRNAELSENRRMEFRIGINLGDVIDEEDRIYGDGVNVAARLEAIADPGGICVSKTAFDQIETKLPLGYEYLGEQSVKNIPKPVGAYRVLMQPRVTVAEKPIDKKLPAIRRVPILVAAVALIGLAISVGIWQFYMSRPSVEPASLEKMAFPMPDKPSIAVLPFTNMSDDPKQEYFCDGMTEDLITDLSKISGLFVIARNSTFVYKGKPIKIKQVAEELGVRYVLEGSVRKAGDKLRINAQLIDATTGRHLWADRYTGIIGDVFNFQDTIGQKIVDALALELVSEEQILLAHKGTDNIEAYDMFLKGWEHYLRWTPKDFFEAIPFFEKAVQIDPNYGRAYAALAAAYYQGSKLYLGLSQFGVSQENGFLLAHEYLDKAMKNPTSLAYYVSSEMSLWSYQGQKALLNAERAIAIEPNSAAINSHMGFVLTMGGNPQKGNEFIQKALRLDPNNPAKVLYYEGLAYFHMEEFEKAMVSFQRSLKFDKEWITLSAVSLAATYAILGRVNDTQELIPTIRIKFPTPMPVFLLMRHTPFINLRIADRLAEGYAKAGLPKDGSSFYYKISDENRLTGEEISELVFGRKTIGMKGILERTNDGKAFYRDLISGSDNGKSWVDNDLLCNQWEELYEGHKICYPVFRNPDGKAEKKNEYIYLTDFAFDTFSTID
jgi:TolB-like protein/class 3 adenylate cyclase/Tfp pilus assembly protein PilF